MELYSENENYKLYHGNMLDMFEVIESNSIDSIVTDPPYGLTSITKRFGKENSAECQYGKDGSFQRLSKGFMGKEWDGSGIEYNIDTWKKCYEVLKPGGYLLAFGGSRTFHRIACAIEDAGFEIRDTIMWLYGSGFPKSMNISLAIDKTDTKDFRKQIGKTIKQARIKKNMTMDELCQKLELNNEGHGGMINHYENGRATPTIELWNKICKILDIKNINDYEENKEGRYKIAGEIKKPITWFGNGLKKEATTDLAKQWQGWGTALKPSFEPIIVARKPFKGSLVDNVIENSVGGINIDECRVETNGEMILQNTNIQLNENKSNPSEYRQKKMITELKQVGRFPANTILTYDETDFEEVCGGFPNTNKSNGVTSNKGTYWGGNNESIRNKGYEDGGSASRYFYCAKASKKDRDEGLDTFIEEKVNDGRNTPIDNAFQRGETLRKNTHPTVKPTELMQYLVRLVTPNGGTVLDPFNGSGSTGKAVMYENHERDKNYKYVGIELTEEYLPISKARIEYVCNLPKEQKQSTIFDYLGDDDE